MNKSEFSDAIKAGRGAASLHIKEFGLSGVADVVLDACLTDYRYDSQMEGSRAGWLFDMFKGTPEYASFSLAIIEELKTNTEFWDCSQLCALVSLIGQGDNLPARDALRRWVLHQAEFGDMDDSGFASELIACEGISAITELAGCYGRALMKDQDRNPSTLDDIFWQDTSKLAAVESALKERAVLDEEVQLYLDYWQKEKAEIEARNRESKKIGQEHLQTHSERVRQALPIEKVLKSAAGFVGAYPGLYTRFGRHATSEELVRVLANIERSKLEEECLRLLWVFRRVDLPRIPWKLWDYLRSENVELRSATAEVLARLQDARLGEFARSLLESQDFVLADAEMIGLLVRNFLPGDEALLMSELIRVSPKQDECHVLCERLLDIVEVNFSPSMSSLVQWAYQNTPCPHCRKRSLQQLIDNGVAGVEVIHESLFDACKEIRGLARPLANQSELG